jgi:hypothetical protein
VVEGDTPRRDFQHANPYSDDVHVDDLATFKGTHHPVGGIFCVRQVCEAAAIIASQDGNRSLPINGMMGGAEVIGRYERPAG